MKINTILIKARVTEKSLSKTGENVYSFYVNMASNKHQIKDAVEKLYGVVIYHIRTSVRKGKVKKVGKKGREKQRPDRKIAYITLKKGKIDIF